MAGNERHAFDQRRLVPRERHLKSPAFSCQSPISISISIIHHPSSIIYHLSWIHPDYSWTNLYISRVSPLHQSSHFRSSLCRGTALIIDFTSVSIVCFLASSILKRRTALNQDPYWACMHLCSACAPFCPVGSKHRMNRLIP